MKHTKGEWTVETVPTSVGSCLKINPVRARIYVDNMHEYCKNDLAFDEPKANAKLIAAAPDLLQSLTDLLAWANIKDGSGSVYLREQCEKAIQKATT